MDIVFLSKNLSWLFLAVANVFLLARLNYSRKDKLQTLIETVLMLCVSIFTLMVFLIVKDYGKAFIAAIPASIPLESIVKRKVYKVGKDDISWRPIVISLLFICSYILGLVSLHLAMPWFIGYLLSLVCFLLGLRIIKKTKGDVAGA